MKTMTTKRNPQQILDSMIAEAVEFDRRGDTVRRNQLVRQLLGDEFGMPQRQVKKALRDAGLVK